MRVDLNRNLVTNLLKHERIVTTLQKAKEMRPWVEKTIHSAKKANNGVYQGHLFLKQTIFTSSEIKKAKEIATRFEYFAFAQFIRDLQAGFTRITPLGRRRNDKGKAASIEIIGNEMEIYEKNQFEQFKVERGLPEIWDWEDKILKQEVQYFQQKIDDLNTQIQQEVEEQLTSETGSVEDQIQKGQQVKDKIMKKHAHKLKFLEFSLKRAQAEERVHQRSKGTKKYENYYRRYVENQPDFDIRAEKNL